MRSAVRAEAASDVLGEGLTGGATVSRENLDEGVTTLANQTRFVSLKPPSRLTEYCRSAD